MRKLSSVLVAVLAMVFAVSTVALAADIAGTITEVNAQKGTLTVQSTHGKSVELQASAEILAGLQKGDVVQVKTSGMKATAIQKQEGHKQKGQ
jgi:hypothetical protein